MAKKSAAASTKPEDGKQDIDALTERYKALNVRKIETEANLKTAEKQLTALRKKAQEDYETDDLATLRTKLQDMKDENERKRAEYQESLDKIENELEAVEKAHAEAASGSAEASEEDEGN